MKTDKRRFSRLTCLLVLVATTTLFWGVDQGRTQTQTDVQLSPRDSNAIIERMMNRVTQADRKAATAICTRIAEKGLIFCCFAIV